MPKRINAHKVETKSITILRELISNEAIFRELSERDYGIDGIVEFFNTDGYMNGEEISVQIKGSCDIVVKKGFVRTPSIQTETVKYWVKKKQSVFILFIDVSQKIIYFADIKHLARSETKKVNSQKTISFAIHESRKINSNCLKIFREEVLIANKFDQSQYALSRAIFNFKSIYRDLILKSGRDCFMIIDDNDPRIDLLNDISKIIKLGWLFFGVDRQIYNFNHFMALSFEKWNYEYVEMHITQTADYLKEQFQFLLIMVIATKDMYSAFWEESDKEVINRLNNEDDFSLMIEVVNGRVGLHNYKKLN
ncbi:DUF4365 domain-containing protein [Acinetobacter modestus]|uniref:DUF4365 domain-containing protein n=1 Tax=Acinetobacter modestus TaxID=1776740 RepID=UPI001F4AF04B|nr:DUF4365 domain-containing protein [Acinetobacter modestus]MCH7330635.1 DUF4365 domain-containing protein [Acinetobacter modestus]